MAGMPELPVEVRAGRLGWSGDPRPTRLATDRRHGGAKFAAAVPAWWSREWCACTGINCHNRAAPPVLSCSLDLKFPVIDLELMFL